MNQRKAGVLLTYFNKIMSMGINLVYVPLLLFYMGKEEYGLYQLMGSVVAYIGLMDFGFSTTVTRFYTHYKALNDTAKMENLLATSVIIYSIIGLIITSVGTVTYFCLDSIFASSLTPNELVSAKKIFILLVIGVLVCVEAQIFTAVMTSAERFVALRGITTVTVICQPVAVLLAMQESPYAFTFVMIQTIFYAMGTMFQVYYAFARLHIKIRFHGWDAEMVKSITDFSLAIFLWTLTDQIFFRSNQIVLGIMSGTAAVAVYAIGAQIYMSYMPLATTISGVFFPKVTEMVALKEPREAFTELFVRIGRLQFLLLALVLSAFVLYGRQFIHFWVGDEFMDAWWVALLVIAPFTIDIITSMGVAIMKAQHDFYFRVKLGLIAAVLNIALAIPAAMFYGDIGCALVTGSVALACHGCAMNWYYASRLKIGMRLFWENIGRISFVVCLAMFVGWLSSMAVDSISIADIESFVLQVVIYIIIYIVLVYNFACNEYEKDLLHQGLLRLRKRRRDDVQ